VRGLPFPRQTITWASTWTAQESGSGLLLGKDYSYDCGRGRSCTLSVSTRANAHVAYSGRMFGGNQLERKRSESLGLRWSERKVSSPRIRLGNSSLVKGLLCFPPCNRSAGWFELGGDEIDSINWLNSRNWRSQCPANSPDCQPPRSQAISDLWGASTEMCVAMVCESFMVVWPGAVR
jgi:hypothetical protein